MLYSPKLKPGDKIAILSPSGGLPEIFPEVFDQGLERLKNIFGLIPVEYPTTRKLNSTPEERVANLHYALSDKEVKGIICSIGGDDQIKLLKYLDPKVVKSNPKFFMGYSDATNLCQYLTQIGGYVTYYGPATMSQFGMSGKMDNYTVQNLKQLFFETGEVEITPSPKYSENCLNWRNIDELSKVRPMLDAPEWIWHNFKTPEIIGETWGGCLEILDFQMRANKYLPSESFLQDKILYLETSEERPDSNYVYRVLMGMGERGWLSKFKAVLVGRARYLETGEEYNQEIIEKYRTDQKNSIIQAFDEYAPETPIVFNLDFGHTDPIFTIPNGGECRIDGTNKKLFLRY
jgi:muramoyltetrapeptide carboxypeptidase LdcA involved in peptidoglycan recycling